MTKNKHKHLTEADRMMIENWLKAGMSIKRIATELGKSPSTISREIRARTQASSKHAAYRVPNSCANRVDCQRRYLCQDKPNCTRRCSTCKHCNGLCEDYAEQVCERLASPPYCCNGCGDEAVCVLRRRYYLHRKAHEAYREKLVDTRSGANISEGELLALDQFLSPLIQRGQSVHHIVANNPDQFDVSEKTIYRYVDGGLLKARNIDMPRVCRLKPRKSKTVAHKVDSGCRIGRKYDDFLAFKETSDASVVEIDTVEGRKGGKVLLTLMFNSCDLMLAFIRDSNTSQSVIDVFDSLYDILGARRFKRLFPVCLGDNGSEFSNPKALEFDKDGNKRTSVFYCDPYSSFQKPRVELNHEFIRKILPKGKPFDHLDQGKIDLMMSNINSYSREKHNDKSPYDLFRFIYSELFEPEFDVLEKLNIKKIPPNKILLKPSLLR